MTVHYPDSIETAKELEQIKRNTEEAQRQVLKDHLEKSLEGIPVSMPLAAEVIASVIGNYCGPVTVRLDRVPNRTTSRLTITVNMKG